MDEYEIPKLNKKDRKIVYLLVAALIVAALVAVVYYLIKVDKPASSESREIIFTVQKGSPTRQIAYQLRDQNIIGSPIIFLIYSALHSAGDKIQAGEYSLNGNMAIPEIMDVLTAGKVVPNYYTITIIEGWSNQQIAQYLADRQIIKSPSDFNNALATTNFNFTFVTLGKQFSYQGFLFPDTYKLSKDATVSDLINKMLENFENKMSVQMLADIQARHTDVGQILILASIIEKEVGRNKQTLTPEDLTTMQNERQLVASVFYNRLNKGMPLESDATVDYVTGKSDRSVSIADSKVESPYNTYLHTGLPPTPISNPGIGSIMAAIYPANSDYLYFLNAPDGTAYFAKTLAEQTANKAKYLK